MEDTNSLRAVRIRAWQKERETNAHGQAEYADAKIAELQREIARADFLQRMQSPALTSDAAANKEREP